MTLIPSCRPEPSSFSPHATHVGLPLCRDHENAIEHGKFNPGQADVKQKQASCGEEAATHDTVKELEQNGVLDRTGRY